MKLLYTTYNKKNQLVTLASVRKKERILSDLKLNWINYFKDGIIIYEI